MFLIDAIKLNVEKKFKTCFIFLRCWGGESGAYKIDQFCVMFVGGNINIILKKREKIVSIE